MGARPTTTFGIDLGIASCGWAVLRTDDNGHGDILGMGCWMFDAPETAKERTPTNQLRRQHRGLRRVIRRRRRRMSDIRKLFADAELITADNRHALLIPGLDPWALRAQGLERRLTGQELAVVLGHIAKHRGFKSNSKRDRGANQADEASKMLKAIDQTRERLAQWRTVGEMFARDEAFADRKRNRDGLFTRSILRDDQMREVSILMNAQRRLGNSRATEMLETSFCSIAFHQLPLQDSEHLVGPCLFEPGEIRAPKRAPSFERFRLLSRLAALRLTAGGEERPLSPDQMARIEAGFGQQKKISFATLRKLLDLSPDISFAGVPAADEKNDCVARSGNAAEGTASLRQVVVGTVGELAWMSLLNNPEKLDSIATILTFRDDLTSIQRGLERLALEPEVFGALWQAVQDGRAFAAFRGAGHISAKACRTIIPYLREGLVYSEACARAGYDHSARPRTKIEDINNPVARKALGEALKQVRALVGKFGLPDAMHIELARDVGKSRDERDDIRNGIERRNKEKDRLRERFLEDVGVAPTGAEDLLRYELWREQKGRCLYSDTAIHPNAIVASDRSVEVDHILPWSRSGDDSFVNKTLCFTRMNQEKQGKTPFEWFHDDAARWEQFSRAVEATKEMKGRKKRNYLLKDGKLLEDKFKPRNLNDTRYACKLLSGELQHLYPVDGKVHVFARPGPLTDRLRRAWGIQGLKKGPDGKRVSDDRHHALDALIVAATSNSALNRLTKMVQEAEARGDRRDFSNFPPPWPDFQRDAAAYYARIFVARSERRRARGEGHAATIRSIVESEDGPVVYERKAVENLTLADLPRIKDAERNSRIAESLRAWIEVGKPKTARPRSPRGDEIAKVSLRTNKNVDVLVRDGAAERGEMTRADVFRRQNRRGRWEYFLVPIYPHQIFGAKSLPIPNRAVQAATPEEKWLEMTGDFEFCWSLYPLSFIEVIKPDGELIQGYSRGVSRSTGALTVSPDRSLQDMRPGIGARTLTSFRKFQVDRLGERFEVAREKRTWHGAVCT